MQTTGVVGAGLMGSGVAQNLAQCGLPVILVDVSRTQLDGARERIRDAVRLATLLKQMPEGVTGEGVLQKITFTTDYQKLVDADLVIENVTEVWQIKKAVFKKLETICPEHCIFVSNTSAIPISKIASVTLRPDKVMGVHFMNPVPFKRTVELIKSPKTSPETVRLVERLLSWIGKERIVVNDSPGFVSNRILMLTINEAIALLQEGVASARNIDRVFKDCFGHKMGPLETADLIGLDTVLYSLRVLQDCFDDPKYTPCALLERMVKKGRLGHKNGHGFFDYPVSTHSIKKGG